ncbi:MAG: undecaprenyl-diphosphate phosphatase [Clostridia bacterium]|nr:undecaprenyl-diphosphate phosphatase [Clostridia bacterium]
MRIWHAIVLGIIQGVAELLPISSSGHLKIFENLMNLPNVEKLLFFDVMLHFGTLIAVFAAYWKDIVVIFNELLEMVHLRKPPRGKKKDVSTRRMILMLIAATLPLALYLIYKDFIETLGASLLFVGLMLLVNGVILYISDRFSYGKKDVKKMTLLDAILIGVAQAFAPLPGISRSGITITTGMVRGLEREYAVKFSFLLSIPAVLGATILELIDAFKGGLDSGLIVPCLIGIVVSAAVGYAAIRLLKFITQRNAFGKFAYYCWGAGLVALILALISN